MASGFEESKGGVAQVPSSSSSSSGSNSSNNNDSINFECHICLELAQDPVVTLCGHLFCWPCLYRWLNLHARSHECPVCKAVVEVEKLVPLYGRGKSQSDPRSKPVPGAAETPPRPTAQRPPTARPPDPNPFADWSPRFMGGTPVGGVTFRNYFGTFGGLIPMLSFQVHGFSDSHAYGPASGFHYGYNPFHGGHGHAFGLPHIASHDSFLKFILLALGVLVVAYLIW